MQKPRTPELFQKNLDATKHMHNKFCTQAKSRVEGGNIQASRS